MENDISIHSTNAPSAPSSSPPPPPSGSFLKGFLQYLPVVQWVMTFAIGAVVFGLSFKDSQTVQAQDVRENKQQIVALQSLVENNKRDREKQLEELKGKVLTKDVFEAYHQNDVARMERIEKLCEQMLQSQNYNR